MGDPVRHGGAALSNASPTSISTSYGSWSTDPREYAVACIEQPTANLTTEDRSGHNVVGAPAAGPSGVVTGLDVFVAIGESEPVSGLSIVS